MSDIQKYDEAISVIKSAILQSQYDAARSVNEKQLMLYYGVGEYISINSRNGAWGSGAIDTISEQLQKELPGLKGFSARNLRNMRMFYEEWSASDAKSDSSEESVLADASAKTTVILAGTIRQTCLPTMPMSHMKNFLHISFSNHMLILSNVIIGMIIANVTFPPSVIIDSVLAALGAAFIKLAVSGVKNYVNSSEKRKDASDYYVIIRTYWKEIINKHMMQKNRSMVYESYN